MKQLLKSLYSKVPFKHQIFKVLKLIWKPSESVYRHLWFKGKIKVVSGPAQHFYMQHYGFQIENEVFWAGLYGRWEKVSFGIWKTLSEDAKVVFDIGANTGIYSLMTKSLNPGADVYAFEPVKRIYDKLVVNNNLNKYNIKCNELALSDKEGTATIYDSPDEHLYTVAVNKNMSPDSRTFPVTIQIATLDGIIERGGITQIDLMKIDVETHEPEVLNGFKGHIKAFLPSLLIEILNDEVGAHVEAIVAGLGYMYFNIDEVGKPKLVQHITKSDYYNYLLCTEAVADRLNLL